MFFSENNRLSKPHFDWPLLIAGYMLALYGVHLVLTVLFRIWSWTPTTAVCS